MRQELKLRIEKAVEEDKREKVRKAKTYGRLEFNREVCNAKCKGVKGKVIYEGKVQPKAAIVRKECWNIYRRLTRKGMSREEAKELILEMDVNEILKGKAQVAQH